MQKNLSIIHSVTLLRLMGLDLIKMSYDITNIKIILSLKLKIHIKLTKNTFCLNALSFIKKIKRNNFKYL